MNPDSGKQSGDPLDRLCNALHRNEPRLHDRDVIPRKVMETIGNKKQAPSRSAYIPIVRRPVLIFAQRLLTAASVSLLILFGVEQYMVVKKVNTLEERMASVHVEPATNVAARFVRSGFTFTSLPERFLVRKNLIAFQRNDIRSHLESTIKHVQP
ncbi:MAG: hypothetical protein D4R67_07535 [Bacteroidetes bacterium]|nr:MAG: hypothetical protein D4R67_07535 [Bacteroidota bacterium]